MVSFMHPPLSDDLPVHPLIGELEQTLEEKGDALGGVIDM
jgi:hypothetical protein